MSRSSNQPFKPRLCNSHTLWLLHRPIRLFVAINHQEISVPNLCWVVFAWEGKNIVPERWANSCCMTWQPSYLSTIDDPQGPTTWSWKVRVSSFTLWRAISSHEVRKYPDFIVENVFFFNIFSIQIPQLQHIVTFDRGHFGAEISCSFFDIMHLEAHKFWAQSETTLFRRIWSCPNEQYPAGQGTFS